MILGEEQMIFDIHESDDRPAGFVCVACNDEQKGSDESDA
jgi:hypothetical protein